MHSPKLLPVPHVPVSLVNVVGRPTPVSAHGETINLVNLASEKLVDHEIDLFATQTLSRLIGTQSATLVPILEGAGMFHYDLLHYLSRQCASVATNSVKASKYGIGRLAGAVDFQPWQFNPELITDQFVVVIDDICDSGDTAKVVTDEIAKLNPKEVVTVFLTRKVGIKQAIEPDYWLFELDPSVWAVGHGMDHQFRLRHLRGIFDIQLENYEHGRRIR